MHTKNENVEKHWLQKLTSQNKAKVCTAKEDTMSLAKHNPLIHNPDISLLLVMFQVKYSSQISSQDNWWQHQSST